MTETPLLGRCREEGCNHVLFLADRALIQEADSFKDVKAGNVVYRCQNAWWSRCPNRHKVFPLKAVKGTYSPDHKCDARCLNAKGHDCTCSCGGMNHGRGHVGGVVTASALPDEPVATEKQANFIRTLLNERYLPDGKGRTGEERAQDALAALDAGKITKKQASKTIEWLLTLPDTTF